MDAKQVHMDGVSTKKKMDGAVAQVVQGGYRFSSPEKSHLNMCHKYVQIYSNLFRHIRFKRKYGYKYSESR